MSDLMLLYDGEVLPAWIDYNGHMNDACYVMAFSQSIDHFMEKIGLNKAYREAESKSLYTLQLSVHYLSELMLGESIQIVCHVIKRDKKRIHLYLTMLNQANQVVAAEMEVLLIHVDMKVRKSAPMDEVIAQQLDQWIRLQADHPIPKRLGMSISI